MKVSSSALFVICVINLSFDLGSARKCYTCAGIKGNKDNCEINLARVEARECLSATAECWTYIARDVISRGCTVKSACEYIGNSTYEYCKTCNSDLCNSESSGFMPSYSTSLAASIAFFILMKLFI